MDHGAVEMIGEKRATGAALHPAGAQHEVIDHQLALAAEQVWERLFSVWAVKDVAFLDRRPGQLTARGAQGIARLGEFLFLREQRFACLEPFILRYDFVLHTLLPLHFRRCHPADSGAPRLLEDRDAADIGYVEDRTH